MADARLQILNTSDIEQKVVRIAHEIHENFYKEKSLVIVGIEKSGFQLAEKIAKILNDVSDLEILLEPLPINKQKPSEEIANMDDVARQMKGKVVILVDDVLNSGRTLMYAVKHILDKPVKSLHTAVLVDRFHRKYPIRADFVGLTLSTNLKEHVSVELGAKKMAAFLD